MINKKRNIAELVPLVWLRNKSFKTSEKAQHTRWGSRGIPAEDGSWIHFDYVPEEQNIRTGGAAVTGKLCVIGAQLDEAGVAALFGV